MENFLFIDTICVRDHTGGGIAGTKKPSRGGLGVMLIIVLSLRMLHLLARRLVGFVFYI